MDEKDIFDDLMEEFRHHRIADDPEPWEGTLPDGVITPSIMKRVIERKLTLIHGIIGESPVEVVCRLSSKIGVIETDFVERATGRRLRTLEEVHAILSQHGIM